VEDVVGGNVVASSAVVVAAPVEDVATGPIVGKSAPNFNILLVHGSSDVSGTPVVPGVPLRASGDP